jgi:hypothetical protein
MSGRLRGSRHQAGIFPKFYTCLREAASAKAGRYLFTLTCNDEKLQYTSVTHVVLLPLPY